MPPPEPLGTKKYVKPLRVNRTTGDVLAMAEQLFDQDGSRKRGTQNWSSDRREGVSIRKASNKRLPLMKDC